jgi:uncharacterized repeat protein (TIGR01451 family)
MRHKSIAIALSLLVAITGIVTPSIIDTVQAARYWVNVQDVAYVPGPPTNANVSVNTGSSTESSLAIDSFGRPHIAWTDTTGLTGVNTDIFYVRWNGTNWVNAAGTIYNGTNANVSGTNRESINPSLALDSNNIPYIIWCDFTWGSNYEPVFVRWDNATTQWIQDNGSSYGGTGNARISPPGSIDYYRPFLRIDSNNLPHVSMTRDYSSDGGFEVIYARLTALGTSNWVSHNGGLWQGGGGHALVNVSQTANRASDESSLALDSNNRPHISWTETGTFGAGQEIAYVRSNGTNWLNAQGNIWPNNSPNVSGNSSISQRSSIEVDTNNRPHIAWSDNNTGNFEINYVRWDGVNWLDITGGIYGTSANITSTSGRSDYPSLELDSTDNPHIAWHDDTWNANYQTCYIYRNGANWSVVTTATYTGSNAIVSANSGDSLKPWLILDAADMPHVSWEDFTYGSPQNWEIMYVRLFLNFTGTFTFTKEVDTDGDDDFNDEGNPVAGGMTLTYRLNWALNNPDGDPLRNAFITDIIPVGSTYVGGTANPPTSSYSTDGGATWILGNAPTSPAGTILRWDIPNTNANANFTATFDVTTNLGFSGNICNRANFRHMYDRNITLQTNEVCNTAGAIGFTKSASKTDYFSNEDIEFTIRVNSAFNPSFNVIVTDIFPAEFIYATSSDPTNVTVAGNILTWTIGNMAMGEVRTLIVTFRLRRNFDFNNTPLTVTNFGRVDALGIEPAFANATVTIHERGATLTKSVNKTLFTKSEIVTFTLTVENFGTDTLTNVILIDEFPSVLSYIPDIPPVGNVVGNVWTMNIGVLQPGEIQTFTLNFRIDERQIFGEETLYFTNNATLLTTELDPLFAETTFGILRPKTQITKTVKQMYARPTDHFTFFVTIANVGGDIASEVVLTDMFPREFEFVSARPSVTAGMLSLKYDIGDLGPKESRRYTLVFKIKDPKVLPKSSNSMFLNVAKISALGLPDKYAYATIIITPDVQRQLRVDTWWKGIDTKTSKGKVNQEIELTISCKEGSSPYEVVVDFGDGTKKLFTAENEEPHTLTHTYASSGDYKVIITANDSFGLSKRVERTILIE